MSGRTVRRFVDGLLRGQRTERARPDDFEAEEMRTAIELRAARTGSDSPREEFVTDLHRRLAEQMGQAPQADGRSWGTIGHSTPGRHRHRARRGIGGHRDRGRPQPARSDPDGSPRPRRQPKVCSNPTRVPGMRSGPVPTSRRGSTRIRPRLGQGVRPPGRRTTGGGLGHMHASGLQALAGCAGKPAALPVPLDVVLVGG